MPSISGVIIIDDDCFNICIVLDFPDQDMVCMICLFSSRLFAVDLMGAP